MKLSRNFVKDYIDLDDKLSIKEIAETMNLIGNKYKSAYSLIPCSGLVTGEVLECSMHQQSDHLHVCQVDVGDEVLQIVCGAPNVRKGIKVIVAKVGSKLPLGIIGSTNKRGVISNGMICSIAELGLEHRFLEAKDSETIHELPLDTPVGIDPIKVLELDDEVIDFDLSPNRGDLLSVLGLAYELGAIYHLQVKEPLCSYKENDKEIKDVFNLSVEIEDCPLFIVKKIENVKIKESPAFIKNRLIASGIRSINNVVDISNYVMLETGQPLHFYDADKLGDTIIVRDAKEKEEVVTLDGKKRILSSEDMVIANKECAVGLAGVRGGLETEVVPDTKNIIIEVAIFNTDRISKTSKKILSSEASNRFGKGIDPIRSYMAIEHCCDLLQKYADASIVKGIISHDKTSKDPKDIIITLEEIRKALGIDISKEEVLNIFNDLSFAVKDRSKDIIVTVPTRRMDILTSLDLINEVCRIYGLNNINGKLPNLSFGSSNYNKTVREIKNKLINLGLNEVLSNMIVKEELVNKYTNDKFEAVIDNKNTFRYSLLSSLKDIYDYNKLKGNDNISIFELGKGFYIDEGKVKDEQKLAVLMSGNYYLGINSQKIDFYVIKGILEELLDYLGYQGRYSLKNNSIPLEFHPYQSANIILQGQDVGVIGKLHPNETSDDVYVFELNLRKVLSFKVRKMTYHDIPQFSSIKKEVAFIIDKNVISSDLITSIKKADGKLLTNIEISNIDSSKDENEISFQLTFYDPKKNISDNEIVESYEKITSNIIKMFKAKVKDK